MLLDIVLCLPLFLAAFALGALVVDRVARLVR